MKKELTLQDYLSLILRRRWILIASTAGVLLATGIYILTLPPVYVSGSVFILETENLDFTKQYYYMPPETVRPLGYYKAIMGSRQYRNRVRKVFFQDLPKEIPKAFNEEAFYEAFANISLSSSEYTDFINLRVRANNPYVAYRMATLATEILKIRCQEIDREDLQNTVNFIEQQITVSKAKLEEAEIALQEFRRETNITIVSEQGGLLNELVQMENKLTEIQTQRLLAQTNIAAYRRRLSSGKTLENGSSSAESEEYRAFKQTISDLETRRQQLIQQHGELHPDVRAVEEEIDQKKRDYVADMMRRSIDNNATLSETDLNELKSWQERLIEEEVNLFTLENQERYYNTLIEQYKSKHPNIMDQSITLIGLMRAQSVAENLYNFLLQKGEEAKIKAATGSGGIRIVDDPVLPRRPIPVNAARNLMLGLILGLGLGFGLALLKEYTDNAIYRKSDLTEQFNLIVMGEIPAYGGLLPRELPLVKGKKKESRDEHLKEGPLITSMALKSGTAESFRALRSNLEFANVDQNIKSVVISSCSAEEGKSLTSANLAIAYALLGEDVIVVDSDLRKPRLHKLFKCQKSPGLTECLVEECDTDQIIHKTKVDHLYLVPSGKAPPNPSEILASHRMEQFVQLVESKAKFVIFDSAPLLPVTDTLVLSGHTDGVLLIVKHGKTNRFDVEHAVEILKNAKIRIVGSVLNQIPVTRGYGYYYYYGRSYKGYY